MVILLKNYISTFYIIIFRLLCNYDREQNTPYNLTFNSCFNPKGFISSLHFRHLELHITH
jgi:hypothetical protein